MRVSPPSRSHGLRSGSGKKPLSMCRYISFWSLNETFRILQTFTKSLEQKPKTGKYLLTLFLIDSLQWVLFLFLGPIQNVDQFDWHVIGSGSENCSLSRISSREVFGQTGIIIYVQRFQPLSRSLCRRPMTKIPYVVNTGSLSLPFIYCSILIPTTVTVTGFPGFLQFPFGHSRVYIIGNEVHVFLTCNLLPNIVWGWSGDGSHVSMVSTRDRDLLTDGMRVDPRTGQFWERYVSLLDLLLTSPGPRGSGGNQVLIVLMVTPWGPLRPVVPVGLSQRKTMSPFDDTGMTSTSFSKESQIFTIVLPSFRCLI